MTPVAGWYPDPSAVAALRFWDGQQWTSSTAASQEALQPAYAAAPQPLTPVYEYRPESPAQPSYAISSSWGTEPGAVATRRVVPRSRKRLYAAIAAVVAVAAAVAVVVPMESDHDKAPSAAMLTNVLLTSGEVGTFANGNFASSAVPPDDPDSGTKADCNGDVNPAKGAVKTDVSRMFTSATGKSVQEDLSYTSGAATLFSQLKSQLAACHTLAIEGNHLTLTTLQGPSSALTGAADVFSMEASGTLPSGVPIAIDIIDARFGNGVVEIVYGASDTAANVAAASNLLLERAAFKAKSAF
jgi:hypothetical protein